MFSSGGTSSDILSSLMTLFLLVLCAVVPVVILVAIYRNYWQLRKDEIMEKFGSAYDGMRLRDENELANADLIQGNRLRRRRRQFTFVTAFYYGRRLILILTINYLPLYLIVQLYSMAFRFIAKIILIGRVKPLATNSMELFNEAMIMVTMYHMICFSDAMPNLKA